jgi:hypothetical protein
VILLVWLWKRKWKIVSATLSNKSPFSCRNETSDGVGPPARLRRCDRRCLLAPCHVIPHQHSKMMKPCLIFFAWSATGVTNVTARVVGTCDGSSRRTVSPKSSPKLSRRRPANFSISSGKTLAPSSPRVLLFWQGRSCQRLCRHLRNKKPGTRPGFLHDKGARPQAASSSTSSSTLDERRGLLARLVSTRRTASVSDILFTAAISRAIRSRACSYSWRSE